MTRKLGSSEVWTIAKMQKSEIYAKFCEVLVASLDQQEL